MEQNRKPETIDYYTYEESMSRAERHSARWMRAAIVGFVAFVVSNIAWIMYESSFVDSMTVTQETPSGNNNYIGHNGDITNGKTDDN